jgi:hypothetical protein
MGAQQIDVLMMVAAILEKLNIAYCVGGSFASSIYGVSRSTRDVDLLAAIGTEQVKALAAELQDDFYADEQAIMRAVRTRRHFNAIHLESGFKVDVFIPKGSPFDEKQLERRMLKSVPDTDRKVYVASAEDTILAKLDWYRRGNEVSDQQWRDVVNVIKVQGDRLDLEYLKEWAAELNVSDLLDQALNEQ